VSVELDHDHRTIGKREDVSALEDFLGTPLGGERALGESLRLSDDDWEPLCLDLMGDDRHGELPERSLGHVRPHIHVPGVSYSDDPLWLHRHFLMPPTRIEQHLLDFISLPSPIRSFLRSAVFMGTAVRMTRCDG
jgi:hypothetical protein